MTVKQSYIDSHWLVFIFQGIISLLFGWYIMFTPSVDISTLITVVGTTLLALGIIEMFNVIYRSRVQRTWKLNLTIAIIEVCVAFLLLFTVNLGTTFQLIVIASYTLARGIFEILIGLKSIDDSTDKFIWLVCGVCGAVLAFVVFNSGHFSTTAFLQFFGAYMTIFGLSNLIYGVHNRDQAAEYKLARSTAAKKAARARTQKSRRTKKSSRTR